MIASNFGSCQLRIEMTVINMDCLVGMRMFPTASIDAIVTDPPYELGFMGKSWDASGIAYSVEMWREALRVLKPGGHLLAFSGSRTYHRMTCAIEDAGFEIRDQIMWVYGSGFPKSLDVSKAIDKAAGAERTEVIGKSPRHGGGIVGAGTSYEISPEVPMLYAPATDAARQWQGWGTALKPAHEPICVARKPLIGTVAANVLAHGTGAINVDGCRVPIAADDKGGWRPNCYEKDYQYDNEGQFLAEVANGSIAKKNEGGRWPANLIHDGSDEVLAAFPGEAHRFYYCAKTSRADRNAGLEGFTQGMPLAANGAENAVSANRGSLSKPRENIHPTVKPTDLMRYLCRLVTPPGGLVLDPFTGSGSTGKAAVLEEFNFLGFEMSAEYAAIANARINAARGGK